MVVVNRKVLGEELREFAAAFVALKKALKKPQDMEVFVRAKRDFFAKHGGGFSERARNVILRMFEDGEAGARGVLSAAKWMRMTKVSRPTALADLSALERAGAIVRDGVGPRSAYRLAGWTEEPLREPSPDGARIYGEPLNDPINERLLKLVRTHPGSRLPYLKSVVGKSASTVKRAIAALVKEGQIEHRGSKKTGGYHATRD